MSHLESMNEKIARLRELGAADEMERRWEDDYRDRYNYSRLTLKDPVELEGDYPEGLRAFFRAAGGATFGDLLIRSEANFGAGEAVDVDGELIDDQERIRIGDRGEDAILLDIATGKVMIYCDTYFKFDWDSGVLVECDDLPELIDTAALGPRYREIRGPVEHQSSAWWEADPWYLYLQEIGMAE